MSTNATTASLRVVDPFAKPAPASPWHFLYGLNPLTKIGSVAPAMIMLIFVRDHATPLAFIALSYLLVLTGARMTRAVALVLFLLIPLGVAVIGFSFALWVDAGSVAHTKALVQLGPWTLYEGALAIGLATGLRLGAILALSLLGGLTTSGPDLVRASVQHLRLPYRVGYTALAAYRFVPRFGHELSVIRAAHRVRGRHGGRGPFAKMSRGWGYIVPLLAGAIRHAERVALAMDSRAFGAHATRTERHLVPLRVRDAVFAVAMLVASAVIFVDFHPWQLG